MSFMWNYKVIIRKSLKAKENASESFAFFYVFFNITQHFRMSFCDILANHEHHWPESIVFIFSDKSSGPELSLQYVAKTTGVGGGVCESW